MTGPATFAELCVAARFAAAGWELYFPHRDTGFDFIVYKVVEQQTLMRPVQVKGKYPTAEKGDRDRYGFVGELSQLHPEMVLAIPYFVPQQPELPVCVAYMPRSEIRPVPDGYVKCEPAWLESGIAGPRHSFMRFFDTAGLSLLDRTDWAGMTRET